MKRALTLSLLSSTGLLCGCLVLSIDPLYTPQDVFFETKLVGTWESDEAVAKFEKKEDAYALTWMEGDEVIRFKATLLRLDGQLFLDLEHAEESEEILLLPVHLFARVKLDDSVLTVAVLEADPVETMANEGRLQVGHKLGSGPAPSVLLTGTTPELQKFVRTNADTIFGDEAVFRKK